MLGCCHTARADKRPACALITKQVHSGKLTMGSLRRFHRPTRTAVIKDPLRAKRAPRSAALSVSGLSPRAIARKRGVPGAENCCRKGCCVICCPGLMLPLDCQVLSSCWPPRKFIQSHASRSRQLVDCRHSVFSCPGRGMQVHARVSWLWPSLVRCDRKSLASCFRCREEQLIK